MPESMWNEMSSRPCTEAQMCMSSSLLSGKQFNVCTSQGRICKLPLFCGYVGLHMHRLRNVMFASPYFVVAQVEQQSLSCKKYTRTRVMCFLQSWLFSMCSSLTGAPSTRAIYLLLKVETLLGGIKLTARADLDFRSVHQWRSVVSDSFHYGS